MAYKIETERLILRNYKVSDIDEYYDYVSRPEVANRLWGEEYKSKESALKRLEYETTKPWQFAITLKPEDKVIGSVALELVSEKRKNEQYQNIKLNKNTKEIGYLLSPKFWGKGIMPEAVKAILALAFKEFGDTMVTIRHNKANLQSAKVQDKVGFKIIDEVSDQTHGKWIDGNVYPAVRRMMKKDDYFANKNLCDFPVKITEI